LEKTIMKHIATAFTALVVAAPALANDIVVPSGTYAIDPAHTRVVWQVNHFGLSEYTAVFNDVSGTLNFNAEDPTASTLVANVDPASIVTAHPFAEQTDFDAELRGAQWLDTAGFPEATFTSNKIEITGDNTGTVEGELTFRGVTQPVTFDVTLFGRLEQHPMAPTAALGFTAEGTIKRSDYGLTTLLPLIGDDVQLTIVTEMLLQQ